MTYFHAMVFANIDNHFLLVSCSSSLSQEKSDCSQIKSINNAGMIESISTVLTSLCKASGNRSNPDNIAKDIKHTILENKSECYLNEGW